MHLPASYVTGPAADLRSAVTGHADAQAGWSQCMQTTGTVCTECARSTNSRWIIDWPRWVSHSLQACTSCGAPTSGDLCAFCRVAEKSRAYEPVPVELVLGKGRGRR